MKVYEIAKEKQMQSKQIVALCAELGFQVKAQNKLSAQQLEIIKEYFSSLETTLDTKTTQDEKKSSSSVSSADKPVTDISKVKKPKKTAPAKKVQSPVKASPKTIAYIVSECEPFTNLGDLGGKIVQSIQSITAKGNNAIIVLPRYKTLNVGEDCLEWVMDVPVKIGQKVQRSSLYRFAGHGVTYLFIGNDDYFDRDNIYGYEDDLERFSFFNRSVLEILPYLGISISEIHVNDWHTSMFPLLQKLAYKDCPYFSSIKTTLNIHDLSFQGWYGANILTEVLGLAPEWYTNGLMRMGDSVNILKSGIETADYIRLTEKSQTQMTLPEMVSCGISSVLEANLKIKSS